MPQQSNNLHRSQTYRHRLGFGLAALLLITLASVGGTQFSAVSLAQTVPPPTPTPASSEQPRPTATPARDRDNNDDRDSSSPAPTATAATTTSASTANIPTITGVVTANRLNVRSGPTTAANVIGTALNGQTLTILGRNADSTWWRICCVADTTTEGWVSAQFVQLTAEAAELSRNLPIVDGTTPTATATLTGTLTNTLTNTVTVTTSAVTTATVAAPSLDFVVTQSPSFAWQGQEVVLNLTVTNTSRIALSDLEMRMEIPTAFRFSEAIVTEEGEFSEELTDSDQVAFSINWPTIAAGAAVSANIRVQIAEDLADGVVLDILAVVEAAEVEPITEGISIGMPPTTLPTFQ